MPPKTPAPARDSRPGLLTPKEAADYLHVSTDCLARWRWVSEGPPYVRFSQNCVRYTIADLDEWVASRTTRPATSAA